CRPRGLVHAREECVDVDGGAHTRRAGDDRVADPLDHPSRLDVEHAQLAHAGDDKSGRLILERQASMPTLREQFARPGAFVVAAELVTSRGLITADTSRRALE